MNRLPLKSKHLYLLALFQLVAGPLVLLQVTVFCSITVRETPSEGVAQAAMKAWKSETFQSLLIASDTVRIQAEKGTLPANNTKVGVAKAKIDLMAWQPMTALCRPQTQEIDWEPQSKNWTSAWPQGPPLAPPREI